MSNNSQTPLRLQPAPDSATVEMLHQLFGDVLIPGKLRAHYSRTSMKKTFTEAINSARIQPPVTTLDHSVKALRYAHIKHVAALIDIRAYRARTCRDHKLIHPSQSSNTNGCHHQPTKPPGAHHMTVIHLRTDHDVIALAILIDRLQRRFNGMVWLRATTKDTHKGSLKDGRGESAGSTTLEQIPSVVGACS